MNFNLMGIRARITMGLAVILSLSLISAGNAVYQNRSAKFEATDVATAWIPAIENLGHMRGGLSEHYLLISDHLARSDTQEPKEFTAQLHSIEESLAAATQIYEETLLTYTDETQAQGTIEKALYADYQSKRDAYFKSINTVLTALQEPGDPSERKEVAQKLLSSSSSSAFRAAYDAMGNILKFNLDGTATASMDVIKNIEATELTMLVATSVIFVVGLVLIWIIPRSVNGPVQQAVALARRIAEGDLAEPVLGRGSDELGVLLGHLGEMQARLAQVVSKVRTGSEALAVSSSEIAEGNHDLSARTERQASALEETAASMEQLSSAVKTSADNARAANQLALSASAVATRGGEVVAQVVNTMKGISHASNRISDIIGVIDGIAFQTNILALNAAVEAARAGEQGRGFAVVANEVRSLAGRSAEAAKEIKSLINDSVERVVQGSSLVEQAGFTMTEVVDAIQRVTGLVGDISASSEEQSLGVSQVGEAVSQMDQVTQQNAALVEQLAAATSGLKSQSDELVRVMAIFRLTTN